jgi:regulator of sigma E protease
MIGGVTVNVILGIFIYAMVLFTWGEEYLPTKNVKYGVSVDTLAYQMGMRDGDKILSVDNKPIENISQVFGDVILNKAQSIQVERDGQKLDIAVTEDDLSEALKNKYTLVEPRFPFDIDTVVAGTPAAEAGIKKGDKIIAINNAPALYFQDVVKILKNNKNLPVNITLVRNTDTLTKTATVTEDGKLGLGQKSLDNYFTLETKKYGLLESFPAGVHMAYKTFDDYIKQLKVLFTVKGASKQLGGFLSIGKIYSSFWDWYRFWGFTAFLSIVLAIMNILPIPALDGGHVMFLLYEIITRRKPNEKFMEYAQYAGMILLLALLLFANGNDVVRLFNK